MEISRTSTRLDEKRKVITESKSLDMSERMYNIKRLAPLRNNSYNPECINSFIDNTLVFYNNISQTVEKLDGCCDKTISVEERYRNNKIMKLIDCKLKLIHAKTLEINNKNNFILEYCKERERVSKLNRARTKRYEEKLKIRLSNINKLYKYNKIKKIQDNINKPIKIKPVISNINIPTERQCKLLEKKELERQQAIQQKQNSIQTEEEYQFENSFPLSPEYNVNLQLQAYNYNYNYDYYKIEDKIDIEIHNFLYGNLYNSTSIF
jgi:hypothetical protein